jgi:hypothetical protein
MFGPRKIWQPWPAFRSEGAEFMSDYWTQLSTSFPRANKQEIEKNRKLLGRKPTVSMVSFLAGRNPL